MGQMHPSPAIPAVNLDRVMPFLLAGGARQPVA